MEQAICKPKRTMTMLSLIKLLGRRRFLGQLGAALLPISVKGADPKHPESTRSTDQVVSQVRGILAKISHLAKSQNPNAVPEIGALGKVVNYPTLGRNRNVVLLQIYAKSPVEHASQEDWWVEIARSGAAVYKITFFPVEKPRAHPHESSWTKDHVEVMSEKMLTLLFPDSRETLKLEDLKFAQDLNRRHKPLIYTNGYWSLTYQRYSKAGYRVFRDTVSVDLDEGKGLRCYLNNCSTEVDETKVGNPIVAVDDAKIAARNWANKMFVESPAISKTYAEFGLSEKSSDGELMIVRPNDMLTCRDFDELIEQSQGVLAWVFMRQIEQKDGKLLPGVLMVFIDAVSGEFRGGLC